MRILRDTVDFTIPASPDGAPSLSVIDDFISREDAAAICGELDQAKALGIKPDKTKTGGARVNYNRGGDGLAALLQCSPKLRLLLSDLEEPSFFTKVVTQNCNLLSAKGLVGRPEVFDRNFYDLAPFLKRDQKKAHELTTSADVSETTVSSPEVLRLGLVVNVSLSFDGYELAPHTDNRYKVIVGLIYLEDIDEVLGGETMFWALREKTPLSRCVRHPSMSNVREARVVQPKAGRLALFVNSNDGYHGVRKYAGDRTRKFIYFAYASSCRSNVWYGEI